MIFCPPRHGKSELCSKHLPAWFLGTFPDRRVILSSYEATFAAGWGRKSRDLLSEFGWMFGVEVSRASSAADNWEIDKHRGGMTTSGIGGAITGRGADLFVIDDPVKNAEESLSPTIREKHWEWWQSVANTRIEPGGAALIMMTRWHPDDLAGRILLETPEEWEVVSLPAIAEHDDPLGRGEGEALWPERWSSESLHKIKQSVDSYWWNALYQQRPSRHGRFEWPDEYFGPEIWCAPNEWPTEFELKFIAIDPSKGKDAKKGDYSGIGFVGIKAGKIYVDMDLARRPVDKIVRDVIEMQRRYGAIAVGVEANAFQELIAPEISRVAAESGRTVPLPLYTIQNNVNKEMRIGRLGPYLSRREFRFKSTASNRLLVEQLKEFPNGDHDDGPDTLEMAIRLGIELSGIQQTIDDGLGHNLLG